jgi:hypothetical protein
MYLCGQPRDVYLVIFCEINSRWEAFTFLTHVFTCCAVGKWRRSNSRPLREYVEETRGLIERLSAGVADSLVDKKGNASLDIGVVGWGTMCLQVAHLIRTVVRSTNANVRIGS